MRARHSGRRGSTLLRGQMFFGDLDGAMATIMADWFWRPWTMTAAMQFGNLTTSGFTGPDTTSTDAISWLRGQISRTLWTGTNSQVCSWQLQKEISPGVWESLGGGTMAAGDLLDTIGQPVTAHTFESVFDTPLPAGTKFRVVFSAAETLLAAATLSWGS